MISTKGRYALRMLVDVAENQGQGNITLSSIAQRQGISEKYLEGIAKSLVDAHILRSVRGKGGGYRLAKPASDVTVWDAVVAAEGSLAVVACLEDGAQECPREAQCRTLGVWRGLDEVVRGYLGGITLEDVALPDLIGNDYVI